MGDMDDMARPKSATSVDAERWKSDEPPITPSTISEKSPYDIEEDREDNSETKPTKGCWHVFTSCVGGIWATRQMTKSEDRELYVRTTIRELVVYILFLVVTCIVTFASVSSTMYYYTKALNDLFLEAPFPDTKNNFKGSTQVMDFWRFVENPLLEGLYWEHWYDHEKTDMQEEDKNILYENRLLGVPRLRQVRVRNDSCTVPPDFERAIEQCYAEYSDNAKDEQPFGVMNDTAWTYLPSEDLDALPYWGQLATYGGGGYHQDLARDKNGTEIILAELRKNLWIERGTRAVLIDFTVYNANINLFCVIKLVFEMPPTGGVIPSWTFKTVRLIRYVNSFDYFVMACEFIFCFFIVYYIVEEGIEIKIHKLKYFKSVWNVLDILVVLLSLLCIGFSVYSTVVISEKLDGMLKDPDKFVNFEYLGYGQVQYISAVAVCVFFAWLKLFKYISFNKTMTQLSSTLSRCAKDVAGFAVMFFIVFFAYAQLGFLLFGTQVNDFNSFLSATFTLLRTILGDFNFHELEQANRVLGPIFFLTYVFFVFFVLLNMFLAIINDTYTEVKADLEDQPNEFEIGDYFHRSYNTFKDKLGRRNKLIDIENTLLKSESDADGLIGSDAIRKNLKKAKFSDVDIDLLFNKYDVEGNKVKKNDVKRMLEDLRVKRLELEDEMKIEVAPTKLGSRRRSTIAPTISGVSFDQFSVLQRRVDRLEHSIGSIVTKIDVVAMKLECIVNVKKQKRTEKHGHSDDY